MNKEQLIDIEKLEQKYLNKFYFFLKYAEDEILEGLKTKEAIKQDWITLWSNDGHSDFDVGAERIIYALFNGKGIGQPNSSPVGSDLFFETKDAYIHIDLKTVEASGNVGDYKRSIFIGENQNSYKGTIKSKNKSKEDQAYIPSLPSFYNKGKDNEKICLTYFITILYNKDNIDILNINLLCMPNGGLYDFYKDRPLSAGKNIGKARFNFSEVSKFELLAEDISRIKVIYLNHDKIKEYNLEKDLDFILSLD